MPEFIQFEDQLPERTSSSELFVFLSQDAREAIIYIPSSRLAHALQCMRMPIPAANSKENCDPASRTKRSSPQKPSVHYICGEHHKYID
jgi:hypothetical protein